MGIGLNIVLDKVSRECGTTVAWLNLRGMIIVGQWYIIELLMKEQSY